jgi:hypothetical protein
MRKKLQEAIMSTPDLPSGFAELEYLEFGGGQNLRPYLKARGLSLRIGAITGGNLKMVCFFNTNPYGDGLSAQMDIWGGKPRCGCAWNFRYGEKQEQYGVTLYQQPLDAPFVIEMNWNTGTAYASVEGGGSTQRTYDLGVGYTHDLPEIAIGKQNLVGGNQAWGPFDGGGTGKLLFAQFWYEEGTLTRDFVPVLDADGVPCLYDKVTCQCFYNLGTGTFGYKIKATGEVVAPKST